MWQCVGAGSEGQAVSAAWVSGKACRGTQSWPSRGLGVTRPREDAFPRVHPPEATWGLLMSTPSAEEELLRAGQAQGAAAASLQPVGSAERPGSS